MSAFYGQTLETSGTGRRHMTGSYSSFDLTPHMKLCFFIFGGCKGSLWGGDVVNLRGFCM